MPQTKLNPGAWCHVEIAVDDVERAKQFYDNCFGWSFQDVPALAYILYTTAEGGIGGGIMKRTDEYPRHMANYVLVEDVDEFAYSM